MYSRNTLFCLLFPSAESIFEITSGNYFWGYRDDQWLRELVALLEDFGSNTHVNCHTPALTLVPEDWTLFSDLMSTSHACAYTHVYITHTHEYNINLLKSCNSSTLFLKLLCTNTYSVWNNMKSMIKSLYGVKSWILLSILLMSKYKVKENDSRQMQHTHVYKTLMFCSVVPGTVKYYI